MHPRRIAAFLLGVWLAASLALCLAAFGSSTGADQAIDKASKPAQQAISQLGQEQARALLQYAASFTRSSLLADSEIAQFGLAVILAICLVGERSTRILVAPAVVMLLLAAFQYFFVTPELTWLGQELAFAPEGTAIPQHDRLASFQHIYGVAEGVKLLIGLAIALALFLIRGGRRHRQHPETETDEVIVRR
jgi:hypothetical protein